MLKGIDINEILEYVSSQDKSDNPTKFLIKNISVRNKMNVFSGAIDSKGAVDLSKIQDRAIDIFKSGIKAIKNLNGVDYTEITDEVIDKVPVVVVMELVGKILEFNFASEAEEKN